MELWRQFGFVKVMTASECIIRMSLGWATTLDKNSALPPESDLYPQSPNHIEGSSNVMPSSVSTCTPRAQIVFDNKIDIFVASAAIIGGISMFHKLAYPPD